MGKPIDLTGGIFGDLTVIEEGEGRSYRNKNIKYRRWYVQCKCGKKLLMRQTDITFRNRRHCGCKNLPKIAPVIKSHHEKA